MPRGRHLTNEIRAAQAEADRWKQYSTTRTCERKHEFLHAIVMAACWRAKVRQLKRRKKGKLSHVPLST